MNDPVRKVSALLLTILLAQMTACASSTATDDHAPKVSGKVLAAAGWREGGGGDWFYPSSPYPHIHLNAPGTTTDRDKRQAVDFIAISSGDSKTRNLATCAPTSLGDYLYKLNTPGVTWPSAQESAFKRALTGLGVAKDC